MHAIYEAIIEKEADDLYTIELPDWGSVTEAESLEAAVRMGTDLLETEVTYALANGCDLPQATFGRQVSKGQEKALLAIKTDKALSVAQWPWVSTAQAAELLGITAGRVRKLVLDGVLRAEKNGRDLLVSRADVTARIKQAPGPGRPKGIRKANAMEKQLQLAG